MPESFSWYFLPWWAQKRSSPLSSWTRMYAWAPQLSQRSRAVSENCDSRESRLLLSDASGHDDLLLA